jgi:hypothetical protein
MIINHLNDLQFLHIFATYFSAKNFLLEIMKALSNLAITTRHSAIISFQKYLVSLYTFKKRLICVSSRVEENQKYQSKNLFFEMIYNVFVLFHIKLFIKIYRNK